jgi:hypothetical protein
VRVKVVRLDDADENASIEKVCRRKNVGVKFKFSDPKIPKSKGKVKIHYMDASYQN